jgi:hypothetical protein
LDSFGTDEDFEEDDDEILESQESSNEDEGLSPSLRNAKQKKNIADDQLAKQFIMITTKQKPPL